VAHGPRGAGNIRRSRCVVYRFEADLYYANAGRFMDEVLGLLSATTAPVRAIVFDASGIDVD
jgi:SulP family sulfate permease